MFLLFDCNNFFASCEQIFRPDWRGKPLVVLSNNDGCIVARSAQAKALGIGMGEPYFKAKPVLDANGVVVCSGNFALYSDISRRVMSLLEEECPEMEQYSIDEAFADVGEGSEEVWLDFARRMRRKIARWTGITVSVGIAPTKTLAKLANETAKHDASLQGVFSLAAEEGRLAFLDGVPAGELWGVGRRLTPKMRALGLRSAGDLARADMAWLRACFGVHGERLHLELNGVSCFSGDDEGDVRKQIIHSRSLKDGIRQKEALREVLCRFVESAARGLRKEKLLCGSVGMFLRTSYFADDPQAMYSNGATVRLDVPGDDTRVLTAAAVALLDAVWKPGYSYKKIGVVLGEFQSPDCVQLTFGAAGKVSVPDRLMQTLDALHQAGHRVHFANQGVSQPWRRQYVSRHYTTRWSDIPEAR